MNGSTRTFRPTRRAAAQPAFMELTFRDWQASNTNMIGRISFDETRISRQRGTQQRVPTLLLFTDHEIRRAPMNSFQERNLLLPGQRNSKPLDRRRSPV